MDESVVRGLITGVFFFAPIAIVAILWRKLSQSQSEGSRRLKLVIKLAVVGLVIAAFASMGAQGIATLAVLVVIGWVIKGYRK